MEYLTGTTRRPCFSKEDDGLAPIAPPHTPGFSRNIVRSNNDYHVPPPSFSRPLYPQRRGSFRSLSSSSSSSIASVSPRFRGRMFDGRFEDLQTPHFLEACFLCKKPLGDNKDIFMYRGDTPFCSDECRKERIEIEEEEEKDGNIRSMKKLRRKDLKKSNSSTSPNRAQQSPICPGTVLAA